MKAYPTMMRGVLQGTTTSESDLRITYSLEIQGVGDIQYRELVHAFPEILMS